ncbi:Coenzyme Q-binding protein coq10, mitochondrial [Neophaeococcomyces mojaviensis]|uniref:Coenzyme Q-binding protein coq10, mitochondrial n=1 Tax=Neophaeococcomyces mojaviensis TaxID=3383035 RepID=A0ACC2ZQY4_9EURO|nr:Coenzyme Q-binding protein coq10, mitochondrial [Knufia sp. JES_112]
MWLLPRSSNWVRTCSIPSIGRQTLLLRPLSQQRTFLDSLLSSALGPCPLRSLTHTKTIPHSASSIFKAVSDVSGYPSFLPFTISSNVTSRDERGYPARASLKVGYDKFGLEEIWESNVKCDPDKGIVEAQSSESRSSGLFEVLQTRWQIQPAQNSDNQTSVKLDLDVKFRNPVYDQAFAQVEGKVANMMITAFEKRVQELEAANKR